MFFYRQLMINSFKFNNIKIQIFLYCFLTLSLVMIVFTAFKIRTITNNQSENYNNHFGYHVANDCFRQGTDLLTEAVRRYVVTMKPEYIESYFDEALKIRHRHQALDKVREMHIDQELKDSLTNAMKASRDLMNTEYHAMHLIALNCKCRNRNFDKEESFFMTPYRVSPYG